MIKTKRTLPARGAWGLAAWVLAALLLLGGAAAIATPRIARSDSFVDPTFAALWNRTDQPVASGAAVRTWMWGPVPGVAKREPYAEGPGGVRLVQYFDKGRMEINNPSAAPSSPFYVTSGLLSVELISGQVQVGNNLFEARAPAQIPLASDVDDPTAPTYASFRAVSSVPGSEHPATDATGHAVDQTIGRAGTVGPLPAGQSDHGVTYAYYEPLTHHNVASVFWQFANAQGPVLSQGKLVTQPVFQPWYQITGLPISEAYWAHVKIAGQPADVLIQAFERRILTYVPSNPQGWQVEMGNIGLHYLDWRYGTSGGLVPNTATPSGPPPPPDLVITGIVTGKSGLDLNEQTVTIVNQGSTPVVMSGWRLVSPKNDHADVYYFPQGFVLDGGATVVVHAGQGFDGGGSLFMRRVTWLFDATGYDGVTLYDAAGRAVASYYLAAGAPPTPLPGVTVTAGVPPTPLPLPTAPPGATATAPVKLTPTPTATPTLPGPPPTSVGGIDTETPTPDTSATPTPTSGPGDITATPTATATVTPTPTAGGQ